MVKSVTLPQWLDAIIYEKFNATFELRPQDVVYNPDQSYDFVRLYLGTYFPRSFAEAYCITGSLLDNLAYYSVFLELEEINILDFCCGTGGELLGMVSILQSRLPNLKRINIDAIDANADSVRFLHHLIEELNSVVDITIEIHINPQCLFVETDQDLVDLINVFNVKYHYILSFKALNEFVQSDTFPNDNIYSKIAKCFSTLLSPCGVFILCDITTKLKNRNLFYPELMNKGVNDFLHANADYKSIIPHACYYMEEKCGGCYMQETFIVSHSKKTYDKTKIAYRVFCCADFANSVMANVRQNSCRAINPSADKSAPYC